MPNRHTKREEALLTALREIRDGLAPIANGPPGATAPKLWAVAANAIGEAEGEVKASDLQFCHDFLHPEGTRRTEISIEQRCIHFAMGDGFGAIGAKVFEINSGWDWSHIRDSTPAALARIRISIERLLAAQKAAA